MKKIGIIIIGLLFTVFYINLVQAQDVGNVEEIQNLQNKIINPDTGEFDPNITDFQKAFNEKFLPINNWMSDNIPWLDIVFGMKPQITWGFILNLLLWGILFDLLILVLPNLNPSIRISTWWFILIGLIVFFSIIQLGFLSLTAEKLATMGKKWWADLLILALLVSLLIGVDKLNSSTKEIVKKREEKLKERRLKEQTKEEAKKQAKEEVEKEEAKRTTGDSGNSKQDQRRREIKKEAEADAASIREMSEEEN